MAEDKPVLRRPTAKVIAAKGITTDLFEDLQATGIKLPSPAAIAQRWQTIIVRHLNFYDERA